MFYQIPETRWIMFFLLYSFLGWVFESCYVSLKSGYWVNRGFLKGPFLPIYGSGAVMMLVAAEPFKDSLILTYFAGVVGATLLELVSGIAIEQIFKVRYWDYSYKRFHYKGYICLSSSIAWGFFTIGMTRWLHPAVIMLMAYLPAMMTDFVFTTAGIAFCVDLVISTREALDLRNILVYMEDARREMQLMKQKADDFVATIDEDLRSMRAESPVVSKISESPVFNLLPDMRISLEKQLDQLQETITQLQELSDKQQKDFQELQERYSALMRKNKVARLPEPELFLKRLKGNPTMVSNKYPLSLDTLRKGLDLYKKEEKEENIKAG
jgi:uncharacterized membrane protein